MKKLLLLLCALTMSVGTIWADKTVYLNPGVWDAGGAVVEAWIFADGVEGRWVSPSYKMKVNGETYFAFIVGDSDTKAIFLRADNVSDAHNWDAGKYWNKIAPGDAADTFDDKTLYTITDWSSYEKSTFNSDPYSGATKKTVYLWPTSAWDANDATEAYSVYAYTDDNNNCWVPFTSLTGSYNGIYTADVPANCSNMILVRGDNAKAPIMTFDNRWNQTNTSISISETADNTIFKITAIGDGNNNSTCSTSNDLALLGTASASFDNGNAYQSNDGNTETRWGSNGGSDTEWFQVEWNTVQTFNTIKLLCENAMNSGYAPNLAFDIQTSNDGTNWTTRKHVWGKNANTNDYITVVLNENVTDKFVRFQGVKQGQYGYTFFEFEVYNIDYSAKTLNNITLNSYQDVTSTNAGRTVALSAIGLTAGSEEIPTGVITWNNGTPAVGTVTNETFNALTAGSTTISATAGGKTSGEITFTVTAPQVLGSVALPYRIWSATQGQGGIIATVLDTEGNAFEGDVTLSWEGSAPVGAVISGKNITFGAASGAGTYTLKATDGVTTVTTPVYMVGTNPDAPTAADADVLAIYSGTYSTENYDGWNTGWEWGYSSRDIVAINSDNCVRIHNVGTYGFPYPSDANLTQYTKLHFDVYSVDAVSGKVKIEKTNIDNKAFTTAAGDWKSVDIDLTGLAVTSGSNWVDIYFGSDNTDKARDVLIDNVYFENETPVVPTTAITVTAPATSVAVDKTLQLTVKNQGDNVLDASDITFESSDNAKATVSAAGVVTGVAEGSVTITATVKGSNPAISNTIDLTITPAPVGQTYINGTHEILVQPRHYTGTFDYELIIISEEAMNGFGGAYWKLNGNSGGTLMSSANITFSADNKTMTVQVRSTAAPVMDTPLYIKMPGEVTFKESDESNPSFDWVEVASDKTYDVLVSGDKAAVIGTLNASNLSAFKTSVGNASIIDISGATIADDIDELTTNNVNAIFDYKTSEAATAATKTTNSVYYSDVRFYGAPNGLTFVDDPANVPLLPTKAYSAIAYGSGKSVVINRTIAANKYVTTYMGSNAGGNMAATMDDGLEAYELTAAAAGQLTFTKVEGNITSGKGYVIHNTTSGSLELTWRSSTDQVYLDESNQAEGSVTAIDDVKVLGTLQTITTDGNQWLLSGGEIKKGNGAKITPYRAYFTGVTLSGDGKASAIFEDGETTKIGSINANGEINVEDGTIYNLAGQRVAHPTKGIYIVNGKKVIIK